MNEELRPTLRLVKNDDPPSESDYIAEVFGPRGLLAQKLDGT